MLGEEEKKNTLNESEIARTGQEEIEWVSVRSPARLLIKWQMKRELQFSMVQFTSNLAPISTANLRWTDSDIIAMMNRLRHHRSTDGMENEGSEFLSRIAAREI